MKPRTAGKTVAMYLGQPQAAVYLRDFLPDEGDPSNQDGGARGRLARVLSSGQSSSTSVKCSAGT